MNGRGAGLLACLVLGCGSDAAGVRRAGRRAARDLARGGPEAVSAHVLPGARASIDRDRLRSEAEPWREALAHPAQVRVEAALPLAIDRPVASVLTSDGWRFAEDPTLDYPQSTPEQALRSFVRATRAKRWDVVVGLAPRRYRVGLTPQKVEIAWTQGESARALTEARDRLARHLGEPLVSDAHEAFLDLGQGAVVRLEREGDLWVVVDF